MSRSRSIRASAPSRSRRAPEQPGPASRNPEWLDTLLQGSFSEIYVIDAGSLRFLDVNPAACANLQYAGAALAGMTPLDLAPGLSRLTLLQALEPLRRGHEPRSELETQHRRRDGTTYPIELRLFYCASGTTPVFIAIGNDLSEREKSAHALRQSEARFRSIVANAPGLVYQFVQEPGGGVRFSYLSEGCHALLGVTAERLRENSNLFLELILPEDRQSYLDAMAQSAARMQAWNWEGRIWVEKWKDVKWINLRSTPRMLPGLGVQWDGLMTNITQSKLEEAAIKHASEQLAELSAHVEMAKERERTRIAREIHDDLGGNLTAIKMALALMKRRLPPDEPGLLEKAAYVDDLLDRTIETVHRITVDLRPSVLDFGLVPAIEWQAGEFEKQSGIPCTLSTNNREIDLDSNHATALFRIFQEALTNISKHANASAVEVRLEQGVRSVRLEVADNGKGIDNADRTKPKSFGIRGMIERASALGGQLTAGPAPDGGTLVSVTIPTEES